MTNGFFGACFGHFNMFHHLKSGKVGENVAIPIPMVDRGRGDPRNILGVILDCDEHNIYTIAVKTGKIISK